jgi:hypothetical protein
LVCIVFAVASPGSSSVIIPTIDSLITSGITWVLADSETCHNHLDGNPTHNTQNSIVAIYYALDAPAVPSSTTHTVQFSEGGPFPSFSFYEIEVYAFTGPFGSDSVEIAVINALNDQSGLVTVTCGNISPTIGDIIVEAGGGLSGGGPSGFSHYFSPATGWIMLNAPGGSMSTSYSAQQLYSFACVVVAFLTVPPIPPSANEVIAFWSGD